MKVLKFGGTSVGTTPALLSLKGIVERQKEPVVVVVSALGGLTDALIAAARLAADGSEQYRERHATFVDRHHCLIDEVVPAERRRALTTDIDRLLDELLDTYHTIYIDHALPDTMLDRVVAFGERMSSRLVTAMLADARRISSLDIVRTRRRHGRNMLDDTVTNTLIAEAFATEAPVTVVPGFISRDTDSGAITNLGRGGSDYTAAILAAALGARILEIWTDVDGFMTADPRLIPAAHVVPTMMFVEAMELCTYGAKVVYPPTIYPVFHRDIPIVIKNTFNPAAPGTFISDHSVEKSAPVKGVTALRDTAMITVAGPWLEGHVGQSARIYNALGRAGVNVFPVTLPYVTARRAAFAVREADAERALEALRDELSPEMTSRRVTAIDLRRPLATVAVVGIDIARDDSVAPRAIEALQCAGITVCGLGQGGSEASVTLLVAADDANEALATLHDLFFAEPARTLSPATL